MFGQAQDNAYLIANRLWNEGHPERAATFFDSLSPSEIREEEYERVARFYLERGDPIKALRHCQRALRVHPHLFDKVILTMAEAISAIHDRQLAGEGLNECDSYLKRYGANNETGLRAHLALIKTQHRLGQFGEALVRLHTIVTRTVRLVEGGSGPWAASVLGDAIALGLDLASERGDFELVGDYLARALRMDRVRPGDNLLPMLRAAILVGRVDEFLERFPHALSNLPESHGLRILAEAHQVLFSQTKEEAFQALGARAESLRQSLLGVSAGSADASVRARALAYLAILARANSAGEASDVDRRVAEALNLCSWDLVAVKLRARLWRTTRRREALELVRGALAHILRTLSC